MPTTNMQARRPACTNARMHAMHAMHAKPACPHAPIPASTHARMPACTQARMHACTHARMHAHECRPSCALRPATCRASDPLTRCAALPSATPAPDGESLRVAAGPPRVWKIGGGAPRSSREVLGDDLPRGRAEARPLDVDPTSRPRLGRKVRRDVELGKGPYVGCNQPLSGPPRGRPVTLAGLGATELGFGPESVPPTLVEAKDQRLAATSRSCTRL